MRSSLSSCWFYVCALSILPLAGCAGLRPAPTPPPTTPTFQLTVTAPPAGEGTITSTRAGISCPSTCTASFAQGTKVTLTAKPGTNYLFGSWSGACTGTGSCSVTLSAPTTVAASFIATEGLNVALAGTGTGTVTSRPAGINCPTTCSATFSDQTPVMLTETAGTNSYFGSWSGACTGTTTCSVTVTAAENVTATFNGPDALTVTTSGTGAGTVTSMPAGISCTSGSTTGCSANFPPGTPVTLSESPNTNDQFSGWTGACTGTGPCSLTLSAATTAVSASFGLPGTLQTSVQHIILYAQENRSLDHYFGAMESYWQSIGLHQNDGVTFDGLAQFSGGTTPTVPGCAAGTYGGTCSPDASNPITSFHLQTACIENQSPFWNEAHNQWDYSDPAGTNSTDLGDPPLNGFAFTAAYDAESNGFMDIEGTRAMGYYDGDDLTYYYWLASNFATSDHWFAPTMSRTQLNRMYIIGATSDGHAYPIGEGGNIIGGLPGNPANPSDGKQIPATPIFEDLQSKGISWKIYVDPTGTSCEGMTGSQLSSCLTANSYINEFQYEETILNSPTLLANVQPVSQFAIDAQNNALADFSLIEPASPAGLDEHPSDSDEYAVNVQDGMAYSANTIINPLMQSPSWSTSALIFTYDEWGGLYDHVPPAAATPPGDYAYPTDLDPNLHDICTGSGQLGSGMCNFSWTGFRVPAIVISPFSNKNYVSHTVRDTTSVLNLVEERFGVAALTNRDAAQPAMDEFFNYTTPPWATPPTPPTTLENNPLQCNQVPPAAWNEPPQLSVAVSGSGTITSNPSGISCSSDYGSACGYVFTAGTSVTLTATPDSGSTFKNWAGENGAAGPCDSSTLPTCTISVDSAEYVQADFQ